MTAIPKPMPPLPVPEGPCLDRNLPPSAARDWLRAGWRDLQVRPLPSLAYGLAVLLVSWAAIAGLFAIGYESLLFPALAGFMVVGPAIAVGLYAKSRGLAEGRRPGLREMLLVRPASGGQVAFTGVLLCLLMLLWMRAAAILYALFFGLLPFPGFASVAGMLFTTTTGWSLLLTGSVVGGLFAAFAFAIGAVSIPMLVDERTDALTAMGRSMALVWNNLPAMLAWGAIVLGLFLLCLATGLLALVVVFPVLGHATWHAWRALRPDPAAP